MKVAPHFFFLAAPAALFLVSRRASGAISCFSPRPRRYFLFLAAPAALFLVSRRAGGAVSCFSPRRRRYFLFLAAPAALFLVSRRDSGAISCFSPRRRRYFFFLAATAALFLVSRRARGAISCFSPRRRRYFLFLAATAALFLISRHARGAISYFSPRQRRYLLSLISARSAISHFLLGESGRREVATDLDYMLVVGEVEALGVEGGDEVCPSVVRAVAEAGAEVSEGAGGAGSCVEGGPVIGLGEADAGLAVGLPEGVHGGLEGGFALGVGQDADVAEEGEHGTFDVDGPFAAGDTWGVAVEPGVESAVGHGELEASRVFEVSGQERFHAAAPAGFVDDACLEEHEVAHVRGHALGDVAHSAGLGPAEVVGHPFGGPNALDVPSMVEFVGAYVDEVGVSFL